MSFWVQSDLQPDTVRRLAASLVDSSTTHLRLAVAYVTYRGVAALLPEFERNVLGHWPRLEKLVVTTFDFGMTEPEALLALRDRYGFVIRISRPAVLDLPGLRPVSAFHPKLYCAESPQRVRLLVGSPNLTDRALTTNTEAFIVTTIEDTDERQRLAERWQILEATAEPLTDELLARYRELRRGLRLPRAGAGGHVPGEDQPSTDAEVPEEPLAPSVLGVTDATSWPTLAQAITDGLDLGHYGQFWVEAGSMSSGGARNQLELPRLGHRFLGFHFNTYDESHHVIGEPVLYSGTSQWTDRPLTWHGNNRMERLNLPSAAHGGPAYAGMAVLFRRSRRGYELTVAPWDSPPAVSWRLASESLGLTFRLGSVSPRLCGLF